jgi:hypothetical protein
MKNDFIDIMHERLSQHEMIEPSGLWREINASMDGRHGKKRGAIVPRRSIYKALAGMAAAAVLAVVMWTALQDGSDISKPQNIAKNASPSPESVEHSGSLKNEEVAENMETVNEGNYASSNDFQPPHYNSQKVVEYNTVADSCEDVTLPPSPTDKARLVPTNGELTAMTGDSSVTHQMVDKQDIAQLDADTLNHQVDSATIILHEPLPQVQPLWAWEGREVGKRGQLPLEITLAYTGLGMSSSESLVHPIHYYDAFTPQNSGPSDFESRYNHHKKVDVQMPVKFGLEVWFPIGRKWKLGSGIGYTYLTMKKLDSNQEYWEKTEVTAHYIGIPLEVSRILWNRRRWSFYAVAGGAIEFNLKSHSRKDYYLYYYIISDSRDERPQFSALARLGVQYGVADRLAFFFEPGVSYYFYNGADSNIYSERPLRFHINMGLRIILGKRP